MDNTLYRVEKLVNDQWTLVESQSNLNKQDAQKTVQEMIQSGEVFPAFIRYVPDVENEIISVSPVLSPPGHRMLSE